MVHEDAAQGQFCPPSSLSPYSGWWLNTASPNCLSKSFYKDRWIISRGCSLLWGTTSSSCTSSSLSITQYGISSFFQTIIQQCISGFFHCVSYLIAMYTDNSLYGAIIFILQHFLLGCVQVTLLVWSERNRIGKSFFNFDKRQSNCS